MTKNHWPEFNYIDFKSTGYLLHRGLQCVGKLKLTTPFENHWSNVALWLSSQGLDTGFIPYRDGGFNIVIDFHKHQLRVSTTSGQEKGFNLVSMSVAEWKHALTSILKELNIDCNISPMPQEVDAPIAFDEDRDERFYDSKLAYTWWRILLKVYVVMQRYHAHFTGNTPPIGFMWGTFDLRDARYNGVSVPTDGINSDFIRRNAMNEAQVEVGWWSGNEAYPHPAFYSFTHPKPEGIEAFKIKPSKARWDPVLQEFILDYADLLASTEPDEDLLRFFEESYHLGAQCAGWPKRLLTEAKLI